jgi:uncharacterized protein
MPTSYPVRTPAWTLTYQGTPITADISYMVKEVTYTDNVQGKAGELSVKLEDRNKLWQNTWYPTQGDLVSLQIGYASGPMLDCGEFQIEDLELDTAVESGDEFTIRALPTWITPAMRTPYSAAFETQTLGQIAQNIANKYGFALINVPDGIDVTFARVTQNYETDLAFLKRIANYHGYDFTVVARGGQKQIVFYAYSVLETQNAVTTIDRTFTIKAQFKSWSYQIYKDANINYFDPNAKALISASVPAPVTPATGDTSKILTRAEDGQQAILKAKGILHSTNMYGTTGTITTPGDTLLVGAQNIAITGFGVYNGKYFIETASHRLTRADGYTTESKIRQLPS